MGNTSNMGWHRPAPTFTQPENTIENKGMRLDAAVVQEDEPVVRLNEGAAFPDVAYTLSVDEIRRLLLAANIEKSKDTIQRYCRIGDLDCRKLGMLQRFYATEKSLKNLIKKLQPVAAAVPQAQLQTDLHPAAVHLDTPAPGIDADEPNLHAPASNSVHPDHGNETPEQKTERRDELQGNPDRGGEVKLVPKDQLDQALDEIAFLRDEVRDARQLKRDLKSISSEMLETFASVAKSNNRNLLDPEPTQYRDVVVNENRAGEAHQPPVDSV